MPQVHGLWHTLAPVVLNLILLVQELNISDNRQNENFFLIHCDGMIWAGWNWFMMASVAGLVC